MDPNIYNSLQSNDDATLQNGLSKIAAHGDVHQTKFTDQQNTYGLSRTLNSLGILAMDAGQDAVCRIVERV